MLIILPVFDQLICLPSTDEVGWPLAFAFVTIRQIFTLQNLSDYYMHFLYSIVMLAPPERISVDWLVS